MVAMYLQLFKILHLYKGIELDRPNGVLSQVSEIEHSDLCKETLDTLQGSHMLEPGHFSGTALVSEMTHRYYLDSR